ncbi:unnamed protein product [Closterium sp. NIES-64]|nr:unnamed protein product [Closterium sp. NIES-64]
MTAYCVYVPNLTHGHVCIVTMCSGPVRFFYCTDADGKVHKAVPCLYGYPADFPESSRASATLQQGTHRPCANCYADKGELTMMVGKADPRTPEMQRDIVRQILACKKKGDADAVRRLWSTHPIEASHWRLPKIHMIRHLLDNVVERGMPHHYSTEMWERTHKGTVKGPVRGSNWSDIPRRIVEEEVQREVYREVAADAGGGRQYASALREVAACCGNVVVHVQAIKTRKPVLTKKYRIMRIGGASDPVYDEYTAALGDEMKGMAAEFKALDLATNNVQVHTAVAIPRTRGGELVAKGTFVKASPRERWYSNVALLNNKKGDWYARCLCIFRALDRDGEWKGYAYVRYYERAGSCKLTGCTQLHKKVEKVRYSVVELGSLQRVVHVCPSYSNNKVFTEFVETVNGVHFSRDRNTLILTIHEAHRITGEVARPVSEHGFSVQHLTNTRVVNIRGSVPEGGLPHLQGVEDALKAHYRVMLMKRAIAAKRFQFDYAASIADVDYGLMLEWLGESWTRVRAATMQRSWWRAGCVPPSWPPLMAYLNDTSATGMFEPLIATCVELQLLIEKFKMRPACYMTAAEFVNCDAGLCVEQGFVATPAASASDDSSGEMSLPDGPLLRDERSRRRVIRNVTNAYVERADELGIPPALVPAEVGASNQEVISRLGRTPVKRARAGLRTEDMAGPSERKDEDDE